MTGFAERGGPACSSCSREYCACHDFFTSFRAFHRGDYDHLLKPKEETMSWTRIELIEDLRHLAAAGGSWSGRLGAAAVKALEGMSFTELREANLARCARWHPRGLNEWSLSDWGVATAGELGEALNVVKKLNRERDGIAGNTASADELRVQLADELADVAIYLDIMAASEGIDLAAAIASKFNRTSEKVGFPERLREAA